MKLRLALLLASVFAAAFAPAQSVSLTVFHAGSVGDGASFQQPPVLASDGRLYGVTYTGGSGNNGLLYRLGKNGSDFQVLQEFQNASTGSGLTRVIEGSDGRLYGLAAIGGANAGGTIWRVEKNGDGFVILRAFTSAADGFVPVSLVEGPDGRIYGTCSNNGANGGGTLWRIAKNGSGFQVLRAFTTAADGGGPSARVTFASDGLLYGTTLNGGPNGGGTIYRSERDGTNFSLVHSFTAASDGASAFTRLLEGSDGALIGATYTGGTNNAGTIYRVDKSGLNFTVLRDLGPNPSAYLVTTDFLAPGDGYLYAATQGGGATDVGGLFRIRPDGSGYRDLANFTAATGTGVFGAFTSLGGGSFLGAAQTTGPNSAGTIFRFSLPAPTIAQSGNARITTRAAQVILRGTATEAKRIEAKVGQASYRSVSTAASWTYRVSKLKRGKTMVRLRAVSFSGVPSNVITVTITRR